jgi:hypothetical protein
MLMTEKPISRKNTNKFKKAGFFIAILALVCVLVYGLRAPILTGLANYLVSTDTPLVKADLIFVLNGDFNTRPFYTSDLYKQGLAPLVVIARAESSPAELLGLVDNPTDIAVEVMKKQGVPAANIIVLEGDLPVTSTDPSSWSPPSSTPGGPGGSWNRSCRVCRSALRWRALRTPGSMSATGGNTRMV